jgi:hypothetical protein
MIAKSFDIFHQLSDKFQDSIDDTQAAEKFFTEFLDLTEGRVNTDFIGGNNYDRITKIEFDHAQGLMTFFFIVPEDNKEMMEMRKMAFPCDTYSMTIKLDTIRFVKSSARDQRIGILVKGVTDNNKCIKKNIKGSLDEKHYRELKTEFYSTEYLTYEDGELTNIIGVNTPIIACWIIPKEFNISAVESKKYLYRINIEELSNRLNRIINSIHTRICSASCKEERMEILQSAGNSLRNICECLLKLEINYYYKKFSKSVDSYHKLVLGNLVNILNSNNLITDAEKVGFNTFVRKVNELSHASGIPADENGIIQTATLLRGFIENFSNIIESDNPWNIQSKPSLPSPNDFIKENIYTWNFSEDIAKCVFTDSGKCRFSIKKEETFIDILKILENKGIYLCNDGFFRQAEKEDRLQIYDRNEFLNLVESIYKRIENVCADKGFDTNAIQLHLNLTSELEKCGAPSHLFTLSEIIELMKNADDSKNNQLVIDEDGYPHLLQQIGKGCLYPVSQETWCPNNWYVGINSSLSDAEPSYKLCLVGWLHYLKTGKNYYSDIYPYIEDESAIIAEIKFLSQIDLTEI